LIFVNKPKYQKSNSQWQKIIFPICRRLSIISEDGRSRRRPNSEEKAAARGSGSSAGGSQEVAVSPPLRRSQEELPMTSRWRRRRWRGESLPMRLSTPPPPPTSLSRHPTLPGSGFTIYFVY
jgi:hypothetical protein